MTRKVSTTRKFNKPRQTAI